MDMATAKEIAENVIIYGGAVTALWYGAKRMYRVARNVEKLVENSDAAATDRVILKEELENHTNNERMLNEKRAIKFDELSDVVYKIDNSLKEHMQKQEHQNELIDKQILQLNEHITEIVSEVRTNGGSSMKDILATTNKNVGLINKKVAKLEKLKPIHISTSKPVKRRKLVRKNRK